MRTIALGLVLLVLVGCQFGARDAKRGSFQAERAFRDLKAQVDFGPRIPGSEGHRQTIDWIEGKLMEAGWEVERQRFNNQGVALVNLIARHPKSPAGDPVLIGAHFDTRPIAERDLSDPTRPVPGANDGASGVAILLELARVLDLDTIKVPIWLVFFDAEDSGGLQGWEWAQGARYFVERLNSPVQAAIIVDMVGDQDLELYFEGNSTPSLRAEIWQTGIELGYPAFLPEIRHFIIDDHTPFLQKGIPAVDIIDFDYPYWHTSQDDVDKVAGASLEQVGRTLETWLETLGAEMP